MKVKFVQDFRGRETGERYFTAGEEWDCEPEQAERLIIDGRAEPVLEPEPESAPAPEPKRAKRGKK